MEKYDIISVVGEGSYGLVMRCRHRESGQYVAIKKFLETEDDPTVQKMALREIRMLKKLRHENLVNMIEVFRRKKRFFIVFEYLEHTVLEELESRNGGLGFITSRKYIYQVLRALDFIHSHDVIHRDIKPENVLVSRLGVIKLCDFGFARPYLENETFTDYVATRWYRSPELLVGDRYGKEVDIWAVGCLYSEMMTGEPLFPGESDIDQLFQIVRVLGKLSARHQILIMKNAMFKGMKQEQNTTLQQLFSNWNRDSIDFLSQCLKMDGLIRPDTIKLLKHELFVRDNFLDSFLTELQTKLTQEMQVNPLMKRIPSYGGGGGGGSQSNSRRNSDEKDKKLLKKLSGDKLLESKDKSGKIHLSMKSNQQQQQQQQQQATKTSDDNSPSILDLNITNSTNSAKENNESTKSQNLSLNVTRTRNHSNDNIIDNNLSKQIITNNLLFKENQKYPRILSAKSIKNHSSSLAKDKHSNEITNFDLNLHPSSPIPFQSLQPEQLNKNDSINNHGIQTKRLSPITLFGGNQLTNGTNLPQYFNSQRRHSNNILLDTQITTKSINSKPNHLPLQRSNVMIKRERDRNHQLLDVNLMPLNNSSAYSSMPPPPSSTIIDQHKDLSPRILPPPQWLTGNLRLTGQGKTTHIGQNGMTNSKKRITDWKSIGNNSNNNKYSMQNDSTNSNDLIFPTISPKKTSNNNSLKKKLPPMTGNYAQDSSLLTPRNFSASSDHINET